MVCPACKRDNEAYRLGESESPFIEVGDGKFKCICGNVFAVKEGAVGTVSAE
jgi:hypothetical protein